MRIVYTQLLTEKKISERSKLLLKEAILENNKLIFFLDERWDNDNVGKFSFFVKNFFIEGELEIKGKDVYMKIEIPFYLFSLKRKLRKIFRNKMREIFYYDESKAYKFKTI